MEKMKTNKRKVLLKSIRPFYESAKKIKPLGHIMFSLLEMYNEKISNDYCSIQMNESDYIQCENNANRIDIISVAFNNEKVIEFQIEKTKKYLKGSYNFIVADNSNMQEKSEIIKEICKKNNISYFKLPQNPWKQANLNHSVALNWIYKNYVLKRKPEIFGFLDHDIFPEKEVMIEEKFNNGKLMYGRIQEKTSTNNKNFWYLWAGFCFFKTDYILNKKVNFSSVILSGWNYYVELDTGGGNYKDIYSSINPKEVNGAAVYFKNEEEHIDEWVHIGKTSFKNESVIASAIKSNE